jgi:hypothetical protein
MCIVGFRTIKLRFLLRSTYGLCRNDKESPNACKKGSLGRCGREDGVNAELCVATLLLRVNMPDHIIWQAVDFVAGPLSHLCETFSLCLVLKGIARKVNAYCGISSSS